MGAVYYADMMEMLPLCDFVMVVCPLTAETKNCNPQQVMYQHILPPKDFIHHTTIKIIRFYCTILFLIDK